MQAMANWWQKCRNYFTQLAIKLAIRLNWLEQAVYTQDELNELLVTNFPHQIPLNIANSQGELTMLSAELTMPLGQDKLHLQFYCALRLSVAGQDIYRAHIVASGSVLPYYDAALSAIRVKDMRLAEIRLVNDDYAFVGSTSELVTLFMPKPVKSLLFGGVQLTLSLLQGLIPGELMNYLSLYSSGSKQRILDFHRPEIERTLIEEVEQDDWCYQLDESDFEEQVFAMYGQSMAVEEGKLVFKFR
ncbi:hypothetical protein J7384_01565 [Endozoicomonas sp. G2_1]|uniref:hypothetical protein n=1 Tax=Endozoicomonas sp. G2_1 TaxID=2821091 RepID=UPI001ADD33FC|nr:hypothetical protein [Endozoicomonas sp. G2_1]MBO9489040.1 hypothetical protein [Endozoicomonas sp. G2_1]